jgi:hypothetical protein
MVGWVAVGGAPVSQTGLGGIHSEYLSPGSSWGGVRQSGSTCLSKRVIPCGEVELMFEQRPASPTYHASLEDGVDLCG